MLKCKAEVLEERENERNKEEKKKGKSHTENAIADKEGEGV